MKSGDTITRSGSAFVFGSSSLRLPYATVTIAEVEGAAAVTGLDGSWSISGLPTDSELTPVITFPNEVYALLGLPPFKTMHQQTFTSREDIDLILFQSVPDSTFSGLAALAGVTIDEGACQVVTTVAVEIASIGEYFTPHGFEGGTASMPPTSGAPDLIYFDDDALPDSSLDETSGDGGVLWGNVEAGRIYKIRARDQGHEYTFNTIEVDCQAGRFINASPPRSLVAEQVSPGSARRLRWSGADPSWGCLRVPARRPGGRGCRRPPGIARRR
ncbi:MAG: hypothetical protein ACI8S6_003125 [Myxococcota bacterium]